MENQRLIRHLLEFSHDAIGRNTHGSYAFIQALRRLLAVATTPDEHHRFIGGYCLRLENRQPVLPHWAIDFFRRQPRLALHIDYIQSSRRGCLAAY